MSLSVKRQILIKRTVLIWIILNCNTVFAQTIWTIGPTLHVNFGGEKVTASFGLESAYWNFSGFPYSIDFAFEAESGKFRIYTEGQTGIGIAGISGGPVLQINTDEEKVRAGFQASVWGNYYLGFDLRGRWINGQSLFSPGMYLKIPFAGRDENGERLKSSGSSRSDWDD